MFNDTVTIYNKVYDKAVGCDKYIRTVIKGVHFEERKGVNVIKSGMEQADGIFIAIPYSAPKKVFLDAKAYERANSKAEFFTMRSGDIIVHGECEKEIENLKEFQAAQEYYTITSVDFYGFGSPKMQHWEVGAK